MKLLPAALLILGLAVANGNELKKKMGVEDEGEEEAKRLLMTFLNAKSRHPYSESPMIHWSFTNCGDPNKEQLLISQLLIGPDPIPKNGDVHLTLRATSKVNITGPIQTSVSLSKQILGAWIKVPCVDGIGSCDYPDLCALLNKLKSCPQPFIDNKVPCKCPLPPGSYYLPGVTFPISIPSSVPIPSGGYKVTINVNESTGNVGCYEVTFNLA